MKRRAIPWAVLIAVTTILIWGQSLMNVAASSAESDSFRDLIAGLLGQGFVGSFLYTYIRKAAHFAEYAVLGAEWRCLGQHARSAKVRRWLPAAGLLTAPIDEALQAITDRAPRVTDVLLDSAGFLCGWLIVAAVIFLWRRLRRLRRRR